MQEEDDSLDDVVYLHRAVPGSNTDSFGWHWAANAGVYDAVISRAQDVSQARALGEPIHPLDTDRERLQRRNELVVAVVDDFLDTNFGISSAADFFGEQKERMESMKS